MGHLIQYEVAITFEDNTRVIFTGEGISVLRPGNDGTIRLRHTKLITDIAALMKEYVQRNKP